MDIINKGTNNAYFETSGCDSALDSAADSRLDKQVTPPAPKFTVGCFGTCLPYRSEWRNHKIVYVKYAVM